MNNQPATTGSRADITTPRHNFMTNLFNIFGLRQHNNFADLDPKIEVSENKNNIMVTAELPGIEQNDIDLEISANGYLTISGEKRHEDAAASPDGYFSEIAYGSFSRTIPLPWDLEYSKASADYTNGVLCVTIPKTKAEQANRQKINVSSEKKAKRKIANKAKKV